VNRSRSWHIADTDYPAIRRVMGPRRSTLDDPGLEDMLVEMFPGTEPEDVENFMQTMQQFGKQAAPLAQKALPGMMKGASQGAVAGPWGAAAGAIGGGTASLLARPQGSPSPAMSAPGGTRVPPSIDVPAPALSAGPAPADAVAQLLVLLSRPETIQALLALLLAAVGRSTVPVGERNVPPTEFANAVAETAAIIAEMSGHGFQNGFPESLLDDQGRARCDVVNPAERALLLVTDLSDLAAAEAAYDDDIEEEEDQPSWTSDSYDEIDPLEGYEDALHWRAFDDD
jgi:hypothetical protein